MRELPSNRVGHSSLELSRLGFGTGSALLGPATNPTDQAGATRAVRHALEQGINFFDTAPIYGSGLSERYLAEALDGVPRDSYVLSTKVGRRVNRAGQTIFDFSRESVRASLEESLERLKLDYVDILLVHFADEYYKEAFDEVFPALEELRSQGVVKAIGAGMVSPLPTLIEVAKNTNLDCILIVGVYSLLDQSSLHEFLPLCLQKGMSVLAAGVLNSGVLGRGPVPGARYNYQAPPPAIVEQVHKIEAVCDRFQISMREAALQFPLAHPAITSLVLGMRTPEMIEENLAAFRTTIPVEFWQTLQAEGLLDPTAPYPIGNPL